MSAAIEVRRLFPGITDNEKARAHVRTIAGSKPLPGPAAKAVRLRPRKNGRSAAGLIIPHSASAQLRAAAPAA